MKIFKPLLLAVVIAAAAPSAFAAVPDSFLTKNTPNSALSAIPNDVTADQLKEYVENFASRKPDKAITFAVRLAEKFAEANKFKAIVDGLLVNLPTGNDQYDLQSVSARMLAAKPGFSVQLVNAYVDKGLTSEQAFEAVKAMIVKSTDANSLLISHPELSEAVLKAALNRGLLKHPDNQQAIQQLINKVRDRAGSPSVDNLLKLVNITKKYVPSYS